MSDKKIILFVDDDLPWLQLVSELMSHRSGGTWEVLLADSGARALTLLKEHAVDLMVCDARMPVMSGLQVIRMARSKHPQMPGVLLTAHLEAHAEEAYLREGVDVVLEKPRSAEGYDTLFLTLSQVLESERKHGFRGVLDHVELQDVIQLECLRRNSSVLDVFTPAESGEIVIRNGVIAHAQAGHLAGEAAFNHLLALKGGEFRLKPYQEPAEITIGRNWEVLLMDAARERDEVAEPPAAETEPPNSHLARPAFPPVQLNEREKSLAHPTRQFIAVSTDGDPLTSQGASSERVAQLGSVAVGVDMWPSNLPGKPLLFEAWCESAAHDTAANAAPPARTNVVVQFLPEAVVLAVRVEGTPP